MVEENKSVLKTKLGLENLKGLADTLTQIKEVKESLDKALSLGSELAKDNSPIGRALAQLIEAQGVKALNEDNVNVLQEVKKTMVEELENRNKTIEELAAKNKELEEDRVIHEVTSQVTSELDRRLPKPGSQGDGSGETKLQKALNDVVADFLEKKLAGGGEGSLTSEQIRSIIREEVGKGGGAEKPEDLVDRIVTQLTMGDKLREKLGLGGSASRFLSNQGGDSGLRTDLVKLLLEDERERLKIQQTYGVEAQRNKHLGTIADTVKENLGTGIAAITAAAKEIKASTGAKAATAAPQEELHTFTCGHCQKEFAIRPEDWPKLVSGQLPGVPCPHCGASYTREQLIA